MWNHLHSTSHKRKIFQVIILLNMLAALSLNAQNIALTFVSDDVNAEIETIEILNLNSGSSLIIAGSEGVLLTSHNTESLNESPPEVSQISLQPNPPDGSCGLSFELNFPGTADIKVIDSFGNVQLEIRKELPRGRHTYEVTGLKSGTHQIIVHTPQHEHTHWIMSAGKKNDPSFQYIDGPLKSMMNSQEQLIPMPYRKNDRLLLKATATDFQRMMTITPTHDQIISFEFISCTDADNHHYAVVKIGEQIWMAENLRTTKFRDGEEIRHIQNSLLWREINYAAYSWYEFNEAYKTPHGALYNWYAAQQDRLCPAGWRMPTDADWYELESFIDPEINNPSATGWRGVNAGYLLKTTHHWRGVNKGNNYYGFSATPAGRRSYGGSFNSMGGYSYWWTKTSDSVSDGWSRYILPRFDYLYRGAFSKRYGFSVRCIRK